MEFKLPEIGEGVYEAELTRWLVQPGQSVKRGQELAEVMTDKATMSVPAPFAGTIVELVASTGKMIKVGQAILTYKPGAEPVAGATAPGDADRPAGTSANGVHIAQQGTASGSSEKKSGAVAVKAAPSVRLMARKLGVDLGQVTGTGPEGRILVEDVSRQITVPAVAPPAPPAPAVPAEPVRRNPAAAGTEQIKPGSRIKMAGLRRVIAEQMTRSKRTIPDYTFVEEVDLTELVKLRENVRQLYFKVGIKLTYLPFFVKAVCVALKEVPLINATLDEENNEIVLHDRYNIGMAVSTPAGLFVPVIKDADKLDIGGIARELERLSNDARMGTIKRDDLRGGTFTITSVGNIGGIITTPVINHPEVGIMGVGRLIRRPVYDQNGNIRPADLIYFSYSFDHRVVDGAVCVQFSNAVVKQLTNPVALLLPANL